MVSFLIIVDASSCEFVIHSFILVSHAVLDRPPETIGEPTIGGNTFSEQLGRNLEVSKCLQEAQLPAGEYHCIIIIM